MAIYSWPTDLVPYQAEFYLRTRTGGSESPFSGSIKTYETARARWVCTMSFRGGVNRETWDQNVEQGEYGPRVDAMVDKLRGRVNKVAIWDFRREGSDHAITNRLIVSGDTEVRLDLDGADGLEVGDYVSGDGRPHRVVSARMDGERQVVTVEPAFQATVVAGSAHYRRVWGIFKLTSDDAGTNLVEAGGLAVHTLTFEEDFDFQFVNHGGDPLTDRPATDEPVAWQGWSTPAYAEDGDLVFFVPNPAGDTGLDIVEDFDWRIIYWAGAIDPDDVNEVGSGTMAGFDATDRILTLIDRSGNGVHATAGTNDPSLVEDRAPTYVANALNGRPGIQFDGVGNYLSITSSMPRLEQPFTAVILAQSTTLPTSPDTHRIFDGATDAAGERVAVSIRETEYGMFAGTSLGGGTSDTDARMMFAYFDGENSYLEVSGTKEIEDDAGAGFLHNMNIGAGALITGIGVSAFLDGYIFLLGFIDGELSADQRVAIRTWAAAHYAA